MEFSPKRTLEEQMRDDPEFAKTVHKLEAKYGGKISDQLIDSADEPISDAPSASISGDAWLNACQDEQPAVDGQGLNPVAAILLALWYSLAAAGAMSMGFGYLHQGSPDSYLLVQNFMWCAGIGIGVAFGVCLARSHRRTVGAVSSAVLSALLLCLLFLNLDGQASDIHIFNFRPSIAEFVIATAALTLLCGLLGTALGKEARGERDIADALLAVRLRHWY
jgi:hypothetical protein